MLRRRARRQRCTLETPHDLRIAAIIPRARRLSLRLLQATMFARVAARVSRACAMNDSLVASGAVDTKLMWQIPRLALALQCSIPPLDAPRVAVHESNSNERSSLGAPVHCLIFAQTFQRL